MGGRLAGATVENGNAPVVDGVRQTQTGYNFMQHPPSGPAAIAAVVRTTNPKWNSPKKYSGRNGIA